MASITPRYDKDGNIQCYQIRVHRGRDASGKQLKPFNETWKPTPGMTARQIKKAVETEAVLFETECKAGNIALEKPVFSAYAEYIINTKEKADLIKHSTATEYKDLLQRINDPKNRYSIGHLKLSEITTSHINQFYKSLLEEGTRTTATRAKLKANVDLETLLKEKKLTNIAIANQMQISRNSVSAARRGETVLKDIADKISEALGEKTEKLFDIARNNDPISNCYAVKYHRLISMVLEQAYKESLISQNVARRAIVPRIEKHEVETLEIDDIQKILAALENEPLKWQVAVNLLIATGARRGEVMGIKWDSVDFSNNTIYLCNNLLYSKDRGIYADTLKTGESRLISVSPTVMKMLHDLKIEQTKLFFKLGIHPSGYVFVQENGDPMIPDTLTSYLSDFAKKYHLKHIHPHQFRHTQASLLINQGIDIVSVSKRLGHKRTSTTTDIYAHLIAKADEVASNVIDDLIYKQA